MNLYFLDFETTGLNIYHDDVIEIGIKKYGTEEYYQSFVDNKNIVFMWSKIKRRYVKKDTFAWTNALAAKEAHCSKGDVKTIMRKLEKLGAIKCIQKGKSGSFTRRANLYRREV